MKSFFGTLLRVIAVLWTINGAAGVVLSFIEPGAGWALFGGIISLLLGWGLFRLGTWLKQKAAS